MAQQRTWMQHHWIWQIAIALLAVLMALVLALGAHSPASQAAAPAADSDCPSGCTKPGGHIRVESASGVAVGSDVTVAIRLENVSDLYGIEIDLTFDPAFLQVQDDKPGTVGVQILPGDFPNPELYFVAQNIADNQAGSIAYAISLLRPAPAANGSGALAFIRFRALTAGTTGVSIARVSAVGSDSCCLTMTRQNGVINTVSVPETTGSVSGRVLVQGRSNHSGVLVRVGSWSALTGTDGRFTISNITPGTYASSAALAGYLCARRDGVVVTSGGAVSLPDVTLLAGDVNGDDVVNIYDLVQLGSVYGSSPPGDPRVDFNQDNVVNVFDLVLLGGNYCKSCPRAW